MIVQDLRLVHRVDCVEFVLELGLEVRPLLLPLPALLHAEYHHNRDYRDQRDQHAKRSDQHRVAGIAAGWYPL